MMLKQEAKQTIRWLANEVPLSIWKRSVADEACASNSRLSAGFIGGTWSRRR